jgi:hypothetical protein
MYKESGKETITDGKKDWGAIVFGHGSRRAWDISGVFLVLGFCKGKVEDCRDSVTTIK